MLVAGEPSGDLLAAELVEALRAALRQRGGSEPQFFGAGGARMAAAGVDLAFDLTRHSVIGLGDVLLKLAQFRRLLRRLVRLALERRPDVVVCVDFSGFNRRFAHALRAAFLWRGIAERPRIVQFVSPQVWASRARRAQAMARDFDLLLCLLPFEKAWYAEHAPQMRVEWVGHPIVERHVNAEGEARKAEPGGPPTVLLLPGSRVGELKRHLPVMLGAAQLVARAAPDTRFEMVLPSEELKAMAGGPATQVPNLTIHIGGLSQALRRATVAIASTGTVTLECALFGVPTVALYRTSWSTYAIAKRIVQVRFLAMPNLLANEAVFPEFIQQDATAGNLAQAARALLNDPARRALVKAKLAQVVASLGGAGASGRAAEAILRLV
jgi:lipid-A-disaccharide synthase